jgi:hypothetical protein
MRFNSLFHEMMRVHYADLSNTRTPSYWLLATVAVQAQYFHNFFLHLAFIPEFIRYLPWVEPSNPCSSSDIAVVFCGRKTHDDTTIFAHGKIA